MNTVSDVIKCAKKMEGMFALFCCQNWNSSKYLPKFCH
jgi:hypothetical protein